MKIVHFSDLHLGMENYTNIDPKTGVSSRFLDFLNSLDFIVDYCLNPKNKVDLVLFGGDAYKTRDPSPTYTNAFAQRMKKIANKLPLVLLVGNHDLPSFVGKSHTLEIFPALDVPNIYVGSSPQVKSIKTKSGKVQIGVLPWLNKIDLVGNLPGKSIEEVNKLITKKLGQIINDLNAKIDKKFPSILLAHYSVTGADYGSEQSVMIGRDMAIDVKSLKKTSFNYIGLGHLHKQQIILKKPLTAYSGSIERVDFGEAKDKKGFMLVDINSKNNLTEYQFIETPARKFLSISIKLSNQPKPTEYIIKTIRKHNIKDSIVKVSISGFQEIIEKVEQSKVLDSLKSAQYIAGVNLDIIDILKKQNIVLATKEMGWQELLKEYFKSHKVTKSRSKKIIETASELVSELEEGL